MDRFGIGTAIRGMVNSYFGYARQTGRTTLLVESAKNGDRIIFADMREAERVRQLCAERNINVECIVVEPNKPDLMSIGGASRVHRTLFDHGWIERRYKQAIERIRYEIDYIERN